jgi:hypothetical protein
MWTAALPIQKSMTASVIHGTAQSGATTIVTTVNKREGMNTLNKAIWTGKALGMGLGGHFGESYYMTLPVHSRFKNKLPGGKVGMKASDVHTGTDGKTTRALVDDSPSGGLAMLRPAVGAGIRYGMVGGQAEQTTQIRLAGVRDVTLKAGFDTSVAPYPQGHDLMGHAITLATIIGPTGALREQNYYKTVYGIKWFGNPYNGN